MTDRGVIILDAAIKKDFIEKVALKTQDMREQLQDTYMVGENKDKDQEQQ